MTHTWTLQRRVDTTRNPLGGVIDTPFYRYVCTCGRASSWCRTVQRASWAMNSHTCDGQLSLDWEGTA
jgi:hypothetical protein